MSQNTIYVKVELAGSKMIATNQFGKEVSGILYGTRKRALDNGRALMNVNGKWKSVDMGSYRDAVKEVSAPVVPDEKTI